MAALGDISRVVESVEVPFTMSLGDSSPPPPVIDTEGQLFPVTDPS